MQSVRVLLLVVASVMAPHPAHARAPMTVSEPLWPVPGVVVHRFTPPRCEKCRGPRGVEIATRKGESVRAAVDGQVTFSGQVSRRRFVVQRLSSGVLLTYGWLADVSAVAVEGTVVARGDVLGTAGERFYLGARVNGRYVDPLALLGLARPRLVGPGLIGRTSPSR